MVGAGDVAAQVDEGLEPFDLGVDGRAIVREDDLVHAADAAQFLYDAGIKAVGFDFPQDYCIRFFLTGEKRPPLPEHVTHHRLLARGVIMFEYLCNTGALSAPRAQFVGLPVKLPDSDGAPARVIVIEGEGA